jgi:hypothetical protein
MGSGVAKGLDSAEAVAQGSAVLDWAAQAEEGWTEVAGLGSAAGEG